MRPSSPGRTLARVVGWSALALATAWGATRYVAAGNHFVSVPAALVPFAIVPAAVGLAVLAATRQRVGAAVGVIVLAASGAAQLPVYVASSAAGGRPFTVVTLNMALGMADAPSVVALARRENADVIALEEMTPEAVTRLRAAGIATDYPYSFTAPAPEARGVGIFSRHPFLESGTEHEWELGAVSASIDLGSGVSSAPRVFAVHVPAPWPQRSAEWLATLGLIAPRVTPIAQPVLVAGDFNATLDHVPFRAMLTASRLTDAADEAGAGWLRTYPANRAFPPVIAIDHVLVRGAAASEVHTVTVAGSDHRAVVATVQLPR